LCLTINVFSQYKDIEIPGGFSAVKLWDHSLETAYWARKISSLENSQKSTADDAFTAGILHDIGRLILASNFPQQYRQVILVAKEANCDLYTAEHKVFGHTHCDAGGYLLGLWGLPVSVVEAVSFHHYPGQSSIKSFSPLIAVHVANVMVRSGSEESEGITSSTLDMDYLKTLKMGERIPVWLEAQSEERV
jgi:HD-like signal output (HDOD) protein